MHQRHPQCSPLHPTLCKYNCCNCLFGFWGSSFSLQCRVWWQQHWYYGPGYLNLTYLLLTWRLVTVFELYLLETYLNSNYEDAHIDRRMYFCSPCVQLLVILKWTAFWSIYQSFMPMQLQALSSPSTCTTPLWNRQSQSWFEQQLQHEEDGEPCNHLSLK